VLVPETTTVTPSPVKPVVFKREGSAADHANDHEGGQYAAPAPIANDLPEHLKR
jgi:hypothetical protein